MNLEGECCIAIMEPGTLCVLMGGTQLETRLESSVTLWAITPLIMVQPIREIKRAQWEHVFKIWGSKDKDGYISHKQPQA